jgi:hypothetical protein
MKIEQFSRILQHRLTGIGQQFTIPTSNDHTDETWSAADLYIGEIGINVTDDSMFFRTNNGIVQVATGASEGASASAQLWSYSDNTVQIGATFTPTAILRNNNSFVDLGSSSLRFKDVYLGGSSDSFSIININNGFTIRNLNDSLITTVSAGTNGAVITMSPTASTAFKVQPIHISSRSFTMADNGYQRVSIATDGGLMQNSSNTAVIAGKDVLLGANANNVVYVGQGRGRTFNTANSLVVGGEFVIAGVTDDGTKVYDESNLIKGQLRLTTVDALVNDLFTYNWIAPVNTPKKAVIQLKAKVLGMAIDDVSLIYSNEIFVTAYADGVDGYIVGEPIIKEVSTFTTDDYDVELTADADVNTFYLKVKGSPTNNIQWLCDYEYQVLLNTN